MIRIQISKSTGKTTYIGKLGKRTVIDGIARRANLKDTIARAKVKGLKTKRIRVL